jgi:hypothetical protein
VIKEHKQKISRRLKSMERKETRKLNNFFKSLQLDMKNTLSKMEERKSAIESKYSEQVQEYSKLKQQMTLI